MNIYWGNKTSKITDTISDLSHGRVIFSKDYPIFPFDTTSYSWKSSQITGIDSRISKRTNKIYKTIDFPNKIILQQHNTKVNTPANSDKTIFGYFNSNNGNRTLDPGGEYIVDIWLENNSPIVSKDDLNILTTTIKFQDAEPPSEIRDISLQLQKCFK